MFKRKMPRFGASSIKKPRLPTPPKPRVKKFAEGGAAGYEEDPKPGTQTKTIQAKRSKSGDRKAPPRKISSMEFIQKYESEAPSSRMREEAEAAVKKPRQTLPGDRATGFKDDRKSPYVDLDEARAKEALKDLGNAVLVSNAGIYARGEVLPKVAKDIAKLNVPLRIKQALRRAKTSRINEAERATDKAGEAARRGVSRKDTPDFSERYRAKQQAEENRQAWQEGRDPKDLYGIMGTDTPNRFIPDWGGKPFRKGGAVKSAASRRADGIAKKGKTRGRFI
jgi:hypothetical protein